MTKPFNWIGILLLATACITALVRVLLRLVVQGSFKLTGFVPFPDHSSNWTDRIQKFHSSDLQFRALALSYGI